MLSSTSKPRRLSARTSPLYALLFPVLWLGLFTPGVLFPALAALGAGGPDRGMSLLVVFVWLAFSVAVFNLASRARTVILDGATLYVSFLGIRPEAIPLGTVRRIEHAPGLARPRTITVVLERRVSVHDPSVRELTFIPIGGEWYGGGDIARELAQLVATAKAVAPAG